MSSFSSIKLLFFLLSILYSLEQIDHTKELIMYSPHLRSRLLHSTFLRAEYLHKLFGILLHGSVLSHLSINSITYICISGLIDIYYIFILYFGYNPKLLYFAVHVISPLATGSLFSWFLCTFHITLSPCLC